MQEPHGPLQFHFLRLDDDDFAFDAAQIGKFVASAETPAVHNPAVKLLRFRLVIVVDGNAFLLELAVQRWKRLARLDMAFAREKKPIAKTARERGLNRVQRLAR